MKTKSKTTLKKLDISLPTGWGELTGKQVVTVAYYLGLGLTPEEMYVHLGAELAGLIPNGTGGVTESGDIGYVYYYRGVGNVLLKAEQIAAFIDALSWVEKDIEPMASPVIEGYIAPDSELYGMCFEQFITADIALGLFGKSQQPQFLHTMSAILYPRNAYDPDKVIDQANIMSTFPFYKLQAILYWFLGVKKFLQKKYPFVFSGGQSAAEIVEGDEILYGALSALNEGRIVDNERIKRMDVHEVLYELNLKIKNHQKKGK